MAQISVGNLAAWDINPLFVKVLFPMAAYDCSLGWSMDSWILCQTLMLSIGNSFTQVNNDVDAFL